MSARPTPFEPLAVIGLGAILPDAHDVPTFWRNVLEGRDSVSEVPSERWRTEDHFNPDRSVPDRSYTKIGAFVRGFQFDPLAYRIPPRVAEVMDAVQKWAVEASRQALADAGYDRREFDRERCAVILGNALAGDQHYLTALRCHLPRFERALRESPALAGLPPETRAALQAEFLERAQVGLPRITEDSMPGELSNVIAGRVAQLFGLRGPNFTTDAACASSLAALQVAAAGLAEGRFDLALTGGVDSSMGPESFVKFSKVGALSPDGSRPFDARANGFVMGEGCGVLLLKRLDDARRDGDRVYAAILGLGSSSDGRGKGITAPNPEGQRLALQRAYASAGLSPTEVGLVEAHGTSTAVGDVVEAGTLSELFRAAGARPRQVPLGSIKSQIGHLKSAAGAAALLKVVLSVHHGRIPPSIHFETPNPQIDFEGGPFYVPRTAEDWRATPGRRRVAAISAFGFGGTNFHVLVGEPGPAGAGGGGGGGDGARTTGNAEVQVMASGTLELGAQATGPAAGPTAGVDLRFLAVGARDRAGLVAGLQAVLPRPQEDAAAVPEAVRRAPERLVIPWVAPEERARRAELAARALARDEPAAWRALAAQGVFRGRGAPGKLAFVFPGQGSQYVGMLAELRAREPVVAETFAEADRVMAPILGGALSDFVFTADTPQARAALQDTTVCQPAMLAADIALCRLLAQHGFRPDLVAGHSLGEYAALVAAGALELGDALLAVSARAKEMAGVQVPDPGRMAAVFASPERVQELLADLPEVVPANYNSRSQTVIAGTSAAMAAALLRLEAAEVKAVPLAVSHAFHSYIVAPAAEPLLRVLSRLPFRAPRIPVLANLDAEPYGMRPEDLDDNLRRLARQVASPVRWSQSLERMHALGARVFVEVGPKKVLASFASDVLGEGEVLAVATNQPKLGELPSFALALGALASAGLPREPEARAARPVELVPMARPSVPAPQEPEVVVSGVSLGLPGLGREVFAEDNTERLLAGYPGIDRLPEEGRRALAGQRIVRLLKDAPGGPAFEVIDAPERVAQLAGQRGRLDLTAEFGLQPELVETLDITTQLAIGAGLLALRDAAIPLVPHHRTARNGARLPIGHRLPESLADETGVIFASAFPGYDRLVTEIEARGQAGQLSARIAELRALADELGPLHAVTRRLQALEAELGEGYHLDRRFIFRALSMGHAQLAELIGARGPNMQLNAACASTTLGMALAEDWIRGGRCRRVLLVAADDITNPRLSPWLVGGLLATGAVTTEAEVERAALPFDRRRNGMIPGMGAAGLVIEAAAAAAERGARGAVRLLGTVAGNSAFHGSRLSPEHISGLMARLVSEVERRHGLERTALARELVFVSHETYTPARGGSASAEVHALRETFGPAAAEILVANTKGFTGHAMAVGLEDAAAVRMLERQVVPPVANHRELDPELGTLNLSRGGPAPVRYALRLAAGFGSQVAMTLTERLEPVAGRIADPARHRAWLAEVTGAPDARLVVRHKTLLALPPEAATEVSVAAAVVAPAVVPAAVPTDRTDPTDRSDPSDRSAEVRAKILEIAAKKTGYPVDMLDPALDLEADLGIDTVKQAEMFSEIRAAFGIPKLEGMKLSDYPTLGHIVEFALQRLGGGSGDEKQTDPTDRSDPSDRSAEVRAKILEIAAKKTGYPVDMLDPALDLEADLGIDTVKQAEMFSEIRAAFGIPKLEGMKLSDYPTLGHIVQFALQRLPGGGKDEKQTDPTDRSDPSDRSAEVRTKILEIAAKKTGYPVDMLDPALDLEADLGIDTVKQAEMFSEIRAAFGIPKLEGMKLSDYPTLGHIVQFALQRLPGGGKDEKQTDPTDRSDPSDRSEEALPPFFIPELVGLPSLADCLPTGVRLQGARVLLAGGEELLAGALASALRERGAEPVRLRARAPEEAAREAAAAGPLAGVLVLPPAGAVVPLDEPDDERFREALDARARLPFRVAQALSGQLRDRSGAFFLVLTRLGGLHGFGPEGPADPLAGASTGFAKALAREWGRCLVKALDLPVELEAGEVARAALGELERGPGAVEIGAGPAGRFGLCCREFAPGTRTGPGFELGAGQVALVLGGTGGIAPWLAAALRPQGGATFWLAGRGPLPAEDDPDVALLARDRERLKAVLAERLRAQGARLTPAAVEAELQRLERTRAAREALARVAARGHRVQHARVDVTDFRALGELVQEILRREGRLDLVVLASGLDHSQALERKTTEGFERILGVKVQGLRALLRSLRGQPTPRLALLGSIAGRFGNLGQVDYAAANDVLAKAARGLGAVTLAFGPWAEVGMASRGSVPQAMAQAGLACLRPAAGQGSLRAALAAGLTGEVVVAGGLGELAAADGLQCVDLESLRRRRAASPRSFPLLGEALGWTPGEGLELEVVFDARRDPYLSDHRIEGVPVVPGVMAVECFAEAVRLLEPGEGALSVEDLAFEAPLKLYRDEPRRARLSLRPVWEHGARAYLVTLETTRELAGGRTQRVVHHRGRVRLESGAAAARCVLPAADSRAALAKAAIYRVFFHGPSFQVLERASPADGGGVVGELCSAHALPRLGSPGELVTQPMLAELAFQTVGLLQAQRSERLALPAGATRLAFPQPGSAPQGQVSAWVEERDAGFRARVVDGAGQVLVELDGYHTSERPEPLPEEARGALRPGEPA